MNLIIGLDGETVRPPTVEKELETGQGNVEVHLNALERTVKRRHVQIIEIQRAPVCYQNSTTD